MPIQTRIRKFRVLRLVIIAIVFLTFGVWGMYDYFIQIPGQQRAYERSELLGDIKLALETEQQVGTLTSETIDVLQRIRADVSALLSRKAAEVGADLDPDDPADLPVELKKLADAISGTPDANWVVLMQASAGALLAERRLPLSSVPQVQTVHDQVDAAINQLGDPKKRGTFDRLVWGLAFIPCLPVGVWMLLIAQKRSKRWFRLGDDGALHFHNGEWPAEDIHDIDMSKWMSRSIARVKHREGREIKLDDYYHDGLHRIVGAIAHRFHPDEWTEEARKTGSEAPPNEESPTEAEPEDELASSTEADDRA